MSCALQCSIEIPQINFGFFAAVVANGISRMDCHQRVMNEKKIPRGQFNLQSATTITTPKCKSTANIFHIKYFRSFLLTTGSAVFFLTELSVCVCVFGCGCRMAAQNITVNSVCFGLRKVEADLWMSTPDSYHFTQFIDFFSNSKKTSETHTSSRLFVWLA